MNDVVIIGGGAIGCASALALAKKGARVRLIERAHAGAEASSAAAGILGAYAEAHDVGPFTQLCFQSLAMYARFAEELRERTGVDIGYRPSGSMRVFLDPGDFEREARAMGGAFGDDAEALDGERVRALEPALAASIRGAVRFRKDCRIDPPALMRALDGAIRAAGVQVTIEDGAARVVSETRGGGLGERRRVTGVALASGETVPASAVVVAAGAWSPIEGSGLDPAWIEPIRGQVIELTTSARPIDHVVFGPRAYLSPRDDGRVLVGATQEHVGFRKAVTVRGIRGLLDGAQALVPSLDDAEINATWAGLRPSTPDGIPILGPGFVEGLVLAAGHFRNGILLAPITGEIVAALVLGGALPADIAPFSVRRFSPGSAG